MSNSENLTSGHLLARNTIINLISEVIPFLVAIFAIPALIGGMGVDRYGVLTLSMMAVGYFGLFDFGLGRAATKFIAEAAGKGDLDAVPELFWTALTVMAACGALAAAIVAALAPWMVSDVLKIPPTLGPESLRAFYMLALSMPFVISGSSFGGTLSAFQRFDLINLVRVPAGILSYLVPVAILPFSHRIDAMVAAMAAVRIAGWVASFAMCVRVVPALRRPMRPSRAALRPMLSFGGWVTVSNIVVPIMAYFDRFLIGATISVAAVAYYTVPQQITGKLCVLPGAITGVAFPAFSGAFGDDPRRAALIFERAERYTFLALFAPAMLTVLFAPEGLTLWVGASFSAHAAVVLRWFAVAILINATAWTPSALVQAAHRPDLTAKLHLAEVPIYIGALLWALPRFGIEGAAVVYAARAAADAGALFIMTRRLLPQVAGSITRISGLTCAGLVFIGLSALPTGLEAKCAFASFVLIGFICSGWLFLLQPDERIFAREMIRPWRILALESRR